MGDERSERDGGGAATRPPVRFGVAGWSYEDWKGVVYPRNCKDTLRAVAERVGLVEINSTFYAVPSAKNCASWVDRTADLGTLFTAKLPREFTHERRWDGALVAATVAGFAPLLASGRCRGLLAQFDYTLEHGPKALELLRALADEFLPHAPLFVEVRHRSWNAFAALDELAALGLGVLDLDYPGAVGGYARDHSGVLGGDGIAYFRLHGRNQAWFRKGAGRDEVYDHEYSPEETAQLEQRIERIAAAARETLVVANNHFHGKAMKVIEELLAWYRRSQGELR